jgi:large subunit ribosomal protein L13
MKTYFAKKEEYNSETRRWYLFDAEDVVLGRLATEVARRLMGKDQPEYTPHVDTGAYVVVVNAEKVRLSGKKMSDKIYERYSGYSGGLKAVRGMLPRGPLGRKMFKKLKVYAGPDHPHTYQKPEVIEISE